MARGRGARGSAWAADVSFSHASPCAAYVESGIGVSIVSRSSSDSVAWVRITRVIL